VELSHWIKKHLTLILIGMIAIEKISVLNIVFDFSDFSHESSYEKMTSNCDWNWIEWSHNNGSKGI
jgi:hypothetical protein